MDWRLLLNPLTGLYTDGFDRTKLYQFRRTGDDQIDSFRLSEQSPYFNVAGLMFRDPLTTLAR